VAGGSGSVGGNGVDDDFSPRLRGTLTREFWIGEEIAHAKVAKYAKENWLLVLGDWGGGDELVYVLFRLEKN
jgi:hypothetical protein